MEAGGQPDAQETAVMHKPKSAPQQPADNWSDRVKAVGGLIAVAAGVFAVLVIAVIAMIKDTPTAATVASAAGGVIATIVGAYFGVKVGTDQAKKALEGQQKEAAKNQRRQQADAAKAEVYAMHLPAEKAKDIMELAEKSAQEVLNRVGG